MDDQGILVMVF